MNIKYRMDKILMITPHLSTGGLPQFLLKKIECLINDFDVYLVEWENITGGRLVVQRQKIEKILGQKLFTLHEKKEELLDIIKKVNPNIIHFEEFPETFVSSTILSSVFLKLKEELNFVITETTHGTGFNKADKRFFADKTMFVSNINFSQYSDITNDCQVIEFPVDKSIFRTEQLKKLGLDPEYKHVMNVGLFNRNKNQSEIFQIANLLSGKKIQFHFFGNMADNFADYWKPLIESTPSNCKIWGEKENMYDFYQCMDLFLYTSKLENRPLSVIEALSYGLPVLMYNLQNYGRDFTKFDNVHFLSSDIEYNSYLVSKLLNLNNYTEVGRESSHKKISAYHILTDIDSNREVNSMISLTQLSKFGIEYNTHISKRYTELPPADTCQYPDKISMEPGGKLTPGHYGCYLGHKGAFYKGIESNSDFILIFECDCVIDIEINEFINKLNLACGILDKTDLLMFSFGWHNNSNITERNSNYWVVNKFYGAHAYLIPKRSFSIIDKMYKTEKWNVTDLLFAEKLDNYKTGIFETPITKQSGGLSILDKVEHADRY